MRSTHNVAPPLALLLVALVWPGGSPAATLWIEAEGLAERGGWVIDQQSMDVMGSPCLLAHGLGRPVADAAGEIEIPAAGEYRVLARTKDWVARWNAPGSPGRFQVLLGGQPLPTVLGTRGAEWSWHEAGRVRLAKGKVTLAMRDLTGFEGRCDAIVLTDDPALALPEQGEALARFRRAARGLPERPVEAGRFDLVVVGGGVAGCCAAVSAARLGLDVALVQDRPVLGGNSSSEVRVWIQGQLHQEPFPVLGEIVEEMLTKPKSSPGPAESFGDELKEKVVAAEKRIRLFLDEHVDEVQTDSGRIVSVTSTNVTSGRRSRYEGRWFVDATGDGAVGFLAGADWEATVTGHMGSSNMWYPVDTGKPAPFPRCPWALDLTDKSFPTELGRLGVWFWESGFDRDTIREAEAIRDHNLRAMYGAWDCLKNVKRLYPNHELRWAAYISGRRESRRLLGEVVLSKEDILSGKQYPDGCVGSTWTIDLHLPEPMYTAACPEDPFLSKAEYTPFKKPYPIPYRCFYSRNVANLFMVGRCISVTHEALGTTRVMGTNGMMGEAIGRAAWLCGKHATDPAGVWRRHLNELKQLLARPTRQAVAPPKDERP